MVPSSPLNKRAVRYTQTNNSNYIFNKRRHQSLQMCEGEELQMTIKKLDENFQVQKI